MLLSIHTDLNFAQWFSYAWSPVRRESWLGDRGPAPPSLSQFSPPHRVVVVRSVRGGRRVLRLFATLNDL